MPSLLEVLYISVALLALVPITLYLRDRKKLYELAENFTPEKLVSVVRKAYPLEDVAKVTTASLVNTALVLSNDEAFQPKMLALAKELTPLAVQTYMQGPPAPPQSPGQALAQQRWGPARGSSPIKIGGGTGAWWEPIAQNLAERYIGGMMAQQPGGNAGQAPVPSSSPSPSMTEWRPPM